MNRPSDTQKLRCATRWRAPADLPAARSHAVAADPLADADTAAHQRDIDQVLLPGSALRAPVEERLVHPIDGEGESLLVDLGD